MLVYAKSANNSLQNFHPHHFFLKIVTSILMLLVWHPIHPKSIQNKSKLILIQTGRRSKNIKLSINLASSKKKQARKKRTCTLSTNRNQLLHQSAWLQPHILFISLHLQLLRYFFILFLSFLLQDSVFFSRKSCNIN